MEIYIKRKKQKNEITVFPAGGSSELWIELQKVLSAIETSSGQGRKMLRLQTQNAETIQAEHLSAARESWVQATQVLI